MVICRTREELHAACRGRKGPMLVPTMGGLHAGHAALVRQGAHEAARRGTICVVTVFVNPTQFDVAADFERYPRDVEADAAVVAGAVVEAGALNDDAPGAGIVYAPAVREVYPEGQRAAAAAITEADLPPQATRRGLEDAFRPGHFAGVVLVLTRLYRLVEPAAAIYGEKDWQQLQVARAMALRMAEAGRPAIEILAGPTIRDPDGLALSSRNRFLTPDQRRQALAIPGALKLAAHQSTPVAAERAMADCLAAAGLTPNYATVRHAETLLPLASAAEGTGRALIACPLGEGPHAVRLLDNMAWAADDVAEWKVAE
jgi:pantoate--beta-alanine ligase